MIIYSDLLIPWLGYSGDIDDCLTLGLEVARKPLERDLQVTPTVDVGVEGDEHLPASEWNLPPPRGRTAVQTPSPDPLKSNGEPVAGEQGIGSLDALGGPQRNLNLGEIRRRGGVYIENASRTRDRVVPMLVSMLFNPRDVVTDLRRHLLDAEVVAGDHEALRLDFVLRESPVGDEILADVIVYRVVWPAADNGVGEAVFVKMFSVFFA